MDTTSRRSLPISKPKKDQKVNELWTFAPEEELPNKALQATRYRARLSASVRRSKPYTTPAYEYEWGQGWTHCVRVIHGNTE